MMTVWDLIPSALIPLLQPHQTALKAIDVQNLVQDSRRVKEGDIFFAVNGARESGRSYVKEALNRGAALVLVQADQQESGLFDAQARCLFIEGLPRFIGPMAAAFFGHPSRSLKLVGVTGTNGKTTISFLIASLAQSLGVKAGVIGTNGFGALDQLQKQQMTTPSPIELQGRLALLRDQGFAVVAMEVSSHALDQYRVAGCEFITVVFSNLSRDHLDYHGDIKTYANAKEQLFQWPDVKHAVINTDDLYGEAFARRALASTLWSYGEDLSSATKKTARFSLLDIKASQAKLLVKCNEEQANVLTPLIGNFNFYNLLASMVVLRTLGYSLSLVAAAVPRISLPQGRMERVVPANGAATDFPLVVVDFAHTSDAIRVVLQALKPMAVARQGRLAVVFGCGGDRDRGKRPLMAQAVQEFADQIYMTSDNPRTESVDQIFADTRAGFDSHIVVNAQRDRREAISKSVVAACKDDIVVILGKGHEKFQDIRGEQHPFDDVDVARKALEGISMNVKSGVTIQQLLDASSGLVDGIYGSNDAERLVGALRIDSRLVVKDDIFIAFAGDTVNGHDYLAAVIDAGAACVIVHSDWAQNHLRQLLQGSKNTLVLVTGDQVALMAALASVYRESCADVPMIALTGSVGKTTVKNLLGHIASKYTNPLVTIASQNNHLGVPMTVSRLTSDTNLGIAELGANHLGEIAAGVALARPLVSVLTGVNSSHIEGFGSLDNTANAKAEILDGLSPGGIAILNQDDHFFSYWCDRVPKGCRIISFGRNEAQVRLVNNAVWLSASLSEFGVPKNLLERDIAFAMPLFGGHNRFNGVIAMAAMIALLAVRQFPWQSKFYDNLASSFDGVLPAKGRLEAHRVGRLLIIDDSYNAAPAAVQSSLVCLSEQAGKKWFVFGGMAELGEHTLKSHQEIGQKAAALGIDQFWAYGAQASASAEAFAKACPGAIACFETHTGLSAALYAAIREEKPACILVKGARSSGMERVVNTLKQRVSELEVQ